MDHIRSRITIRMRNRDNLQQVDIYCTVACTPLRGAAGHIFESVCQQHFQGQILINYVPIIQLTGHDA